MFMMTLAHTCYFIPIMHLAILLFMPIIIMFIKGVLPSIDEMDFCTKAPEQWVVSSPPLLVYIQKAEKILYLPLHHQEPSECHCITRIHTCDWCNWWHI